MELTPTYKTFQTNDIKEIRESSKERNGHFHNFLCCVKLWHKKFILFFTLLVFAPLVTLGDKGKVGYTILVMAIYWIFDVAHMSTIAFIPLLFYPLLGVMKASTISGFYFQDLNVLFLSGLMMAVAMESWDLHKRIALKVMLLIGIQPERMMIAFMLTTALISMWMSNTATTAMMVPIAESVLVEMENEYMGDDGDSEGSETTKTRLIENDDKSFKKMATGLLLSISFAANIGGTMTLTGTGPNILLVSQLQRIFGEEASISFSSWFIFSFPVGVLILICGWICLDAMFMGCRLKTACCCKRYFSDGLKKTDYAIIINREYAKLGKKMSFAEKAILAHFTVLALLWVFRDPKFFTGWSYFFKKGFVSDGTAGMFIVISLFLFPSKLFSCKEPKDETRPSSLLNWDMVSKRFPWHILILLGGGIAMAEGAKVSGLSTYLGSKLTMLSNIPVYAVVLVICLFMSVITEFSSNTGAISLFLPVVATLSQTLHIHPYYLMIPATICSSFAFMFPIATPPNAIVFSTGRLHTRDMLRSGVCMDIIAISILLIAINTYGKLYFHLDTYPTWASYSGNTTIG